LRNILYSRHKHTARFAQRQAVIPAKAGIHGY